MVMNKTSRQRGVTLTEMVVASALLMASIAPIVRSMTVAQATTRKVEIKSRSLTLAQGRLAFCRAQVSSDYNTSLAVSNDDCGHDYLCTITDDLDSTCRTVVVTVGLDQDGSGSLSADEESVTLSTLIAKY